MIQVGQEGNREFPMIIIANKIDLKEDRVVSRKELQVRSLPFLARIFCRQSPSFITAHATFHPFHAIYYVSCVACCVMTSASMAMPSVDLLTLCALRFRNGALSTT